MRPIRRLANLVDEAEWLRAGESLSRASDMLAAALAVRGLEPTDDHERLMLVPEMLYAFAVENWLKAILIAAMTRASAERQQEMLGKLRDVFGGEEEFGFVQFLALLFLAFARPAPEDSGIARPLVEAAARQEQQIGIEDSARLRAIQSHATHNLVLLADTVNLRLDREGRRYLDVLSDIVQVGRYPAHFRKDTPDLTAYVGNATLRKKLDQAASRLDSMRRFPACRNTILRSLSIGCHVTPRARSGHFHPAGLPARSKLKPAMPPKLGSARLVLDPCLRPLDKRSPVALQSAAINPAKGTPRSRSRQPSGRAATVANHRGRCRATLPGKDSRCPCIGSRSRV